MLSEQIVLKQTKFFINGAWVEPASATQLPVIDPATEQEVACISLGSADDVNKAVAAARIAFGGWSQTSLEERIGYLETLEKIYIRRFDEMAAAISTEMGAPLEFSKKAQAASGLGHLRAFIVELKKFEFEKLLDEDEASHIIVHEPIGVCGLITPWNWPMNQVTLKVIPAVGVGCTVVLKPSEVAPLSSILFADMMEEASFPAGVFNMINGDGATVGEAISAHADIDMVSFTGSTRAGIAVSKAAADTVKRTVLELGGKSPNIIFTDADVETAVAAGAEEVFMNAGQSCDSPSRMLVERSVYEEAVKIAADVANNVTVGDPCDEGTDMGPLVSDLQFSRVQSLINKAIAEGNRVAAGGAGKPAGLEVGYYVRPTVFADVSNNHTIARQEVFGPVLSMIPFDTEEEAIEIANDTKYGLAAQLWSNDSDKCHRVARRLRAGIVAINGKEGGIGAPFGGYKQSGNGREGGRWGILDFLEVKSIAGW